MIYSLHRHLIRGEKKITLERGLSGTPAAGLAERGHELEIAADFYNLRRGQLILRNTEGVLCGASEPRADGYAAAI